MTINLEETDEYTGDNLPLEIEERKDNIATQYKEYVESLSREELIELHKAKLELLTTEQLRQREIEDDYMGCDNCDFEPN